MEIQNKIVEEIEKNKLIAIIRGVPREKLLPLCQALYDGGVRLLEVTYRPDGSVSDEETAENIRLVAQQFAGKLLVGAGTVLTERQVELTQTAGGLFAISPNVDKQVIQKTKALGLVSLPGALTPSEICEAQRYEADFVKLFPAADMGPGYVKNVKAPLSHVKLLAVGGIGLEDMKTYLRAGVCGFGIGSGLTHKEMIRNNDWQGITQLAERYVREVKNG